MPARCRPLVPAGLGEDEQDPRLFFVRMNNSSRPMPELARYLVNRQARHIEGLRLIGAVLPRVQGVANGGG